MIVPKKQRIQRIQGLLIFVFSGIMIIHTVAGLAGNRRRHRRSDRSIYGHRGRANRSQSHQIPISTNNSENKNNMSSSKQAVMLAKAFRIMYDQGGTTAVMNGCRDTLLEYEAPMLVDAALLAGNLADGRKGFRNRGISSGILNALLGCCCCYHSSDRSSNSGGDDRHSRANMAVQLMKAYDAIGRNGKQQGKPFEPDLVALCLAHVATSGSGNPDNQRGRTGRREDGNEMAAEFLRRAEEFYEEEAVLSMNDTIEKIPDWFALEEQYGIRLLQDEKEFVVLSKPSGMVCYHGKPDSDQQMTQHIANKRLRRKRNQRVTKEDSDKSLEECLFAQNIPLSTLNKEGRGLVHRIDRGTSGCLVVAKTNRMHALLLAQFFLRRSEKSYQALVCSGATGGQPALGGGEIDIPIDSRPAVSRYTFETSVGSHLSRIRVETEQGRRHQVRIHCSEGLRAPILLDPLYGGQSILSTLLTENNGDVRQNERESRSLLVQARASQKFCLHASTLRIDALGIDAEAPLPKWWKRLEKELQ